MKKTKNKIKPIALTIALAILYNVSYAQEEPVVPVTEEVVPAMPATEGIVVEEKPVDPAEVPVEEVKALPVEEEIVVTESGEKENVADPVLTNEQEEQKTDNEKVEVVVGNVEGNEDKTVSNDAVKEEEVKKDNDQPSEEKEVVINSLEETILFRFLQDYAFLKEAAMILEEAENTKGFRIVEIEELKELGALEALQFASLNQKLYTKLIELAENESFPVSDLDQKMADEKDNWSYFMKTNPNLSDLFSLYVDFTFRKQLNENTVSCEDQLKLIKNNANSIQRENLNLEILRVIYDEALKSYLEYVTKNKEILQKIEVIVNNGFQIKNETDEKRCINYRNKEYCSTTRPIKSLRELMAYVQKK